MFVAVDVGGGGVFVAVDVGGSGVFVAVDVGPTGVSVAVAVGGSGVFVAVDVGGIGVLVEVLVAPGVAVGVGVGVAQKSVLTGVVRSVYVPSPSCPNSLSPQHWTVHESMIAQAKSPPVPISSAPVIPLTEVGEDRSSVLPSPI